MRYRILGKTGFKLSEIGLGTWSFGADWGNVSENDAVATMEASLEKGVNFFDTADVYGDGRSEQIIAKFLSRVKQKVYVATKIGRRVKPFIASKFNLKILESFIDRSLRNLRIECLDLVQLHCPPTDVYYMPEVFTAMDTFITKGKIRHYGVSIEKIEEGIKAMEYPGVSSIQVIYNMFRQRPAENLFKKAMQNNVGIIVRVPLASGLLTGTITKNRIFPINDHRNYNRTGKFFDRGETFAGIDVETGLRAVTKLKTAFPDSQPLSAWALRFILMEKAVSTTIPGAKNANQAILNASASDYPALSEKQMTKVSEVYERNIKPDVHQRW